jgi:hypothetical protein
MLNIEVFPLYRSGNFVEYYKFLIHFVQGGRCEGRGLPQA